MPVQWSLVFFTLFSGLGASVFAFVALAEWFDKAKAIRMPGAITAVVAMAVGGVASVTHIGHLDRVFNVLGHLTSPITQEMILMGLTGLVIVTYIIMLRRNASVQAKRTVALTGFVLAVVVAFAVGRSYVLPSRPAWNTWLLPLFYLASAAVLGLYVVTMWIAIRKEQSYSRMANRVALIALIVQALLLAAYVVYLAYAPFQNPLRSPSRLLTGDLALVFWGAVVVVGLLIPFGLTGWVSNKASTVSPMLIAIVGTVCVLLGGIAFRAQMYLLGSSVEQFF